MFRSLGKKKRKINIQNQVTVWQRQTNSMLLKDKILSVAIFPWDPY